MPPEWSNDSVRAVERESIRSFLKRKAAYFRGSVLDFGCGDQPYRDLVIAQGAKYVGFDRTHYAGARTDEDVGARAPLGVSWDAILCTQVVQYVPDPRLLIEGFAHALRAREGTLVMTYPTCWDEVEAGDLWRFTREGMQTLLVNAGFEVSTHERRAEVDLNGFKFALGYGVVAQAV